MLEEMRKCCFRASVNTSAMTASHCRTNDSKSVQNLNIAWEVKWSDVTGDAEMVEWL